jgi:hypothetical protein
VRFAQAVNDVEFRSAFGGQLARRPMTLPPEVADDFDQQFDLSQHTQRTCPGPGCGKVIAEGARSVGRMKGWCSRGCQQRGRQLGIKADASGTRLERIVAAMPNEPIHIAEFSALVGLRPRLASAHLSQARHKGLVEITRHGWWVRVQKKETA